MPEDNVKSSGLCSAIGSSTSQEDKEESWERTEEEEVGRHIQEDKVPSVLESMSCRSASLKGSQALGTTSNTAFV